MDNSKITVTLDEVNSSQVDQELHRQDIAGRMAEHQEQVRLNLDGGAGGGFLRKAIVYMALFGIVFSVLAWGASECIYEDNPPLLVARNIVSFYLEKNPQCTQGELIQFIRDVRREAPELQDNPFLSEQFLNLDEQAKAEMVKREEAALTRRLFLWYILIAAVIALGLAIAEGCVSHNWLQVSRSGFAALVLGALGGFLVALFIDRLYQALGGGDLEGSMGKQIFARTVAWGVLGLFVAVAPGMMMRSGKKLLLGCLGGLIGGMVGGTLFDPICTWTGSVVMARFVNVVGLGVGTAVAMTLLESAAKRGWLRVLSGVITGKQFILYRNPTVIGSSPKCEIYLFKDTSILPQHAAINQREGEFYLSAVGTMPVLVNDRETRQTRLRNGDRVRIGQTVMQFESKTLEQS